MSGQTRLGSFVESIVNVAIGYGIALLSQILIFPLYDIEVTMSTHAMIGVWFTVISILRSYTLRRIFNRIGTPRQWVEGRQ